ncbi:MAG TPA: hypothetical protein VKX17_18730 [Planctomycetota bacterium]|nr:hypothetical protein [Planctomycetota bacterium]
MFHFSIQNLKFKIQNETQPHATAVHLAFFISNFFSFSFALNSTGRSSHRPRCFFSILHRCHPRSASASERRNSAPKGRHILAQGVSPGFRRPHRESPERAAQRAAGYRPRFPMNCASILDKTDFAFLIVHFSAANFEF